ncbi:MAM and LDL-receptor class A domain-containing protein 1-like, partial [Strongylocentrotus purpuratus]|uniref:MAM domain-containing protein n=1 Tax=Strongylocentrotus purpuratus TaxID=7668 RepID=A0A7M7T4S5_STRPU
MWGADIGTLNIYAKTGTTLGQVLWTQSGALSRNWFQAQIDFIPTADFKFVFEGVTGADYESDIALDDIYITTGACGGSICGCDFDLDLCTFTQATTDDIDWTRLAGNTPSTNTGPENDHTIGTAAGFYIYTEASNLFNKVAVLESELILASSGRLCADFWYHMWGADIGTLNIYVKTGTTLGQVLWTQSGALSRNWFQA